ncbi:NUCLEAR FRAGILE X MENTAL RETARDATION PROTEIN INTERACTING PROTEIN 1 [Salix koriyanagi]|uniref:NUCLEAR FRAGILE X MENTAL RETARDATION PROTEIN INTERACTING PROTEIN 1 n=1 Tax=Salix koriyanagi TaxID=2511006 RepID=A0A9Q1AIZ6_9ROSI|nr:NUCLEAR FRAGILE X MENTAL RETARDATION PROTEIN INTERACTING PROTEIN 1 [Salix koriyanagi]
MDQSHFHLHLSKCKGTHLHPSKVRTCNPQLTIGGRAILLKMARVALQIPNEETFQEKTSKIIQRESNHNQGIRNLSSITWIMERESSGFLINTVEKGKGMRGQQNWVALILQAKLWNRKELIYTRNKKSNNGVSHVGKHFPTKTNIEKKLTESLIDSGVIDKEANFRRKQLKEILAKQAELGVEVAEIPPEYMLDSEKLGVEVAETPTSYLLDSEKLGVEAAEIPPHHLLDSQKQEHGRGDNRKSLTKKGRFRNKHDRRGRYKKKDRSDMQTGLENEDRKPTLLEKLLCADIRRDKHRLLQVFRFMVANSFFKDWSDKPLKFPSVVVKEDGCEDEQQEEKSSLAGEEASEVRNNTAVEPGNGFVIGKCDIIGEVDRVEEGEIID